MRDTILVHLIMFGPHNLHNLKVLTERDNCKSNPMAEIAHGVGSTQIGPHTLGPVHMGPKFQVKHFKSQRVGKVPTFKPHETIKIWFIFIEIGYSLSYPQKFMGLVLRVGSSVFLDPNSTQVPTSSPKSITKHAFMSYLGLRTWDRVWSGKSQLPCSRRLRLHGSISSHLGLRTWDLMWADPSWKL